MTPDEKRIADIEARAVIVDGKVTLTEEDYQSLIASRLAWKHTAKCFSVSEWREINTAPKDDTEILAVTNDGWVMIWSAEMLNRVMTGKQPFHLQFPATHWMPLPEPPTP